MKVEKRIVFTDEEVQVLERARQIFEQLDELTDDGCGEGCEFCPVKKYCSTLSSLAGCPVSRVRNTLTEMTID